MSPHPICSSPLTITVIYSYTQRKLQRDNPTMHFDGTTLDSIQAVHSLKCISGNLTSRKVPITSGLERRLQTEYCLGRGIGIQTQEPSIDRKSSGHTTPMSYVGYSTKASSVCFSKYTFNASNCDCLNENKFSDFIMQSLKCFTPAVASYDGLNCVCDTSCIISEGLSLIRNL